MKPATELTWPLPPPGSPAAGNTVSSSPFPSPFLSHRRTMYPVMELYLRAQTRTLLKPFWSPANSPCWNSWNFERQEQRKSYFCPPQAKLKTYLRVKKMILQIKFRFLISILKQMLVFTLQWPGRIGRTQIHLICLVSTTGTLSFCKRPKKWALVETSTWSPTPFSKWQCPWKQWRRLKGLGQQCQQKCQPPHLHVDT